jgi:hypothetical protein
MTSSFIFSVLAMLLTASGAGAQSVDPPRYSVGDTWTLSTGRIVKVITVEDDFVVMRGHVSACPSCLVYFDKNLNSMRVTTHNGEPIDPTDRRHNYLGPAWKWFDWPLEKGKSWGFSDRVFIQQTAQSVRVRIKVLRYEDVKTIGGTFKAFRMRQDWYMNWPGFSGNEWTQTVWYAPEVKTIVKSETTSYGGTDWQLRSYSVKSE